MSWGPVPREYYDQRLIDCREAHEFATAQKQAAEAKGEQMRAWAWGLERERLASSFAEFQRKRRMAS